MNRLGTVRPRRATKTVATIVGALALALVAPLAASASVATVEDDTARVNGTVYAIAQVGDRTIIGGKFTTVGGQPRANVAALLPDGRLDRTWTADTDGTVYALSGSADGSTVFIGGLFGNVDGQARANLAAVTKTGGNLVSGWTADTTGTTPEVLALATSGDKLYVGGRYGTIDGVARRRLAAVNTATGNVVTGFRPTPSAAAVKFLSTASDGSLFAGGAFNQIGGQTRESGIAQLDGTTGTALPFNVAPVGSVVTAMGVSPDAGTLYFGVADNRVFAYDVATSSQLWSIKNGGDTQAIAASATEVYMGGHFGQNLTTKTKRQWILSTTPDGALTSWDPKLGGGSMGVWAITATPTALLVGGEFTSVNGSTAHPRFAKFSGTP